jgi:ABC-type transport system substrate-binding protein
MESSQPESPAGLDGPLHVKEYLMTEASTKDLSPANERREDHDREACGPQLSRRTVLQGAAGAVAGAAALGVMTNAARAAQTEATAAANPPADAAPPEGQIWRQATDPSIPKVLDFYEAVYQRPAIADLFSDSLVRLTKDFKIIPAAATEWSSTEDGKTWTFKLDPNLVWSDGNPVTAQDWVKTFQYSADPDHAWDFTWFWRPVIVGYADATDGKAPLDSIGVKQGADEHELIFQTIDAAPYLPAMLLYSLPLSAAALAKYGGLYNTDPKTAVSSGPFILEEWVRDQQITYKRNPTYKGTLNVPIQKAITKLAAPSTNYTLYEAGEIDFMENPAPAELKIVQSDPELSKQLYQGVGDFRVDYLFFDVTKKPFTDLKVRQAFSHVIDRDAIKEKILGPLGNPSYGFLAPGFPAANQDALKGIQNYDPDAGKKLLADAGYPDGKGFPKLDLWLRAPTTVDSAVAGAAASMLKQHLNIDVELVSKDQKTFTDALNAKPTQILFGFVSYGMDYLDPSNMLGVWKSGGRHSWSNAEFDKLYDQATPYLGDEAERLKIFQQAEKVLVEDVPAVFVYYRTPVQFIKSYVKGDALQPDENGIKAMHWPNYCDMDTVPNGIYIGNDAPPDRK